MIILIYFQMNRETQYMYYEDCKDPKYIYNRNIYLNELYEDIKYDYNNNKYDSKMEYYDNKYYFIDNKNRNRNRKIKKNLIIKKNNKIK